MAIAKNALPEKSFYKTGNLVADLVQYKIRPGNDGTINLNNANDGFRLVDSKEHAERLDFVQELKRVCQEFNLYIVSGMNTYGQSYRLPIHLDCSDLCDAIMDDKHYEMNPQLQSAVRQFSGEKKGKGHWYKESIFTVADILSCSEIERNDRGRHMAICGDKQIGKTVTLIAAFLLEPVMRYLLHKEICQPILVCPGKLDLKKQLQINSQPFWLKYSLIKVINTNTGENITISKFYLDILPLPQSTTSRFALDQYMQHTSVSTSETLKKIINDAEKAGHTIIPFVDEGHHGTGIDGVHDRTFKDVLADPEKYHNASFRCCSATLFNCLEDDLFAKVLIWYNPKLYIGCGVFGGSELPKTEEGNPTPPDVQLYSNINGIHRISEESMNFKAERDLHVYLKQVLGLRGEELEDAIENEDAYIPAWREYGNKIVDNIYQIMKYLLVTNNDLNSRGIVFRFAGATNVSADAIARKIQKKLNALKVDDKFKNLRIIQFFGDHKKLSRMEATFEENIEQKAPGDELYIAITTGGLRMGSVVPDSARYGVDFTSESSNATSFHQSIVGRFHGYRSPCRVFISAAQKEEWDYHVETKGKSIKKPGPRSSYSENSRLSVGAPFHNIDLFGDDILELHPHLYGAYEDFEKLAIEQDGNFSNLKKSFENSIKLHAAYNRLCDIIEAHPELIRNRRGQQMFSNIRVIRILPNLVFTSKKDWSDGGTQCKKWQKLIKAEQEKVKNGGKSIYVSSNTDDNDNRSYGGLTPLLGRRWSSENTKEGFFKRGPGQTLADGSRQRVDKQMVGRTKGYENHYEAQFYYSNQTGKKHDSLMDTVVCVSFKLAEPTRATQTSNYVADDNDAYNSRKVKVSKSKK